jgi:predicted PurR-regulated permease PerM
VTPTRVGQAIHHSIDHLNQFTAKLPDGASLHVSADNAVHTLQSMVPGAGQAVLDFLGRSSGNIVDFFTGLILYIVLLFFLFLHQDSMVAWMRRISPFAEAINDRYLSHMSAAGRSMVLGTFVVGAVQGALGALFLTIAGVPYPIFWLVILTILSFIPLGGGILTIPIGIIQLLMGNIWQGLFILGSHFLVVTNIDNVLRAFLVSKEAQLPPVLTLFAAFAGINFFGALGVIYGPIIMAVIMTSIQIYNEFNKDGIPLKSEAS